MDYIFKILKHGDEFHILLSSGVVNIISLDEARNYIFNYDSLKIEKTTNPAMIRLLDNYEGEILVTLTESNKLEIHSADFLRKLVVPDEFPYFTVDEYAEYHSKKRAMVNRYCINGRIPGAIQKGKVWLIPKTARYPEDMRFSENKDN